MASTNDIYNELMPGDMGFFRASMRMPDPDPILRKWGGGVDILDSVYADEKVTSVIETRQAATTLKSWNWVAGSAPGADGPTSRATEMRDLLSEHLSPDRMVGWSDEMLDAPYYGVIPVELIWDRNMAGYPYIAQLRPWESEVIQYTPDGRPIFCAGGKQREIPYGKMIFLRHKPRRKNPYGRRILSRLLWPVTFKRAGLKYWAKFMKRYGIPKTLGFLPDNIYDDKKGETLDMMEVLVEDAVAVFRKSMDIDTKIGGDGDGSIFRSHTQELNSMIAETVLGQPLTTTMPARGTQALGTVQERVEVRRELADEMMIRHAGNEIGKLLQEFLAPGEEAPRYTTQSDPLSTERLQRDRDIAAAAQTFTPEYFSDTYGIDERYFRPYTPAADFAESEREAIDRFVSEQIHSASGASDRQVQDIVSLLRQAQSYEDVERILLESLDTDPNSPEMQDLMQQAMVAAHLYGRASMRDR